MEQNAMLIWAGVGVVALVLVVLMYNSIIQRKNRVVRAWSDVISFERQKLATLPTLEEKLGEYQAYERKLMDAVTALRAGLVDLQPGTVDAKQLEAVEAQSRTLKKGLSLTAEAYPDLKTSNVLLGFMRELSDIQANIRASITIFNSAVESFNSGIQMFPWSLVNALLNHEKNVVPFTDTAALGEIEYRPNLGV